MAFDDYKGLVADLKMFAVTSGYNKATFEFNKNSWTPFQKKCNNVNTVILDFIL